MPSAKELQECVNFYKTKRTKKGKKLDLSLQVFQVLEKLGLQHPNTPEGIAAMVLQLQEMQQAPRCHSKPPVEVSPEAAPSHGKPNLPAGGVEAAPTSLVASELPQGPVKETRQAPRWRSKPPVEVASEAAASHTEPNLPAGGVEAAPGPPGSATSLVASELPEGPVSLEAASTTEEAAAEGAALNKRERKFQQKAKEQEKLLQQKDREIEQLRKEKEEALQKAKVAIAAQKELEQTKTKHEKKHEKAVERANGAEKANADLKKALSEAQNQSKSLLQKLTHEEDKVADLRRRLQAQDEMVADLRRQLQDQDPTELGNKVASLQSQLRNEQNLVANLRRQLQTQASSEQGKKVTALQKQLRDEQNRVRQLQAQEPIVASSFVAKILCAELNRHPNKDKIWLKMQQNGWHPDKVANLGLGSGGHFYRFVEEVSKVVNGR